MKAIAFVLSSFLVMIGGLVLYVQTQVPNDFSITVTKQIEKPCAKVFDLVAQTTQWESWSPWKKLDPETRFETSPTQIAGPGAKLIWKSKKSGNGSITMLDFKQGTQIKYEMDFEGWASKSIGQFDLIDAGQKACKTTWTMSGSRTLFEKAFWLILSLDQAIEKDFRYGLDLLGQLPDSL